MNSRTKNILFINRRAPYGSSLAKDALDALLAASAYDQNLSVLFMDDGVFQLLENQNTVSISQKSFSAMLPALSIYDINNIYILQDSLTARQITSSEITIKNATIINSAAAKKLLSEQDQILSF